MPLGARCVIGWRGKTRTRHAHKQISKRHSTKSHQHFSKSNAHLSVALISALAKGVREIEEGRGGGGGRGRGVDGVGWGREGSGGCKKEETGEGTSREGRRLGPGQGRR